ncbi:LPXTG cell wall anchor domain-containing protein [Clostridium felsineum]|uniref:LPXTG cell wall anchor domain-containing protein n=1 Tax=Clostridium felsineum TaxID=36839 RepID=UPI00098CE88E|nr:LPXTG cell wall anchor domain-containing protein [Clostridium felsineum]URZ14458.1 hypothetical protein CLFE_004550 [Clostridium felsineum DSM 794]
MKLKFIKSKCLTLMLTLTMTSTLLPNYISTAHAASTSNYNPTDWKQATFGQTTDTGYNSIVTDDSNKAVTLTAGTADGTHAGGKITGSHDGISYYYTSVDPSKNFVLTADVKVNFFAKPKPDNQEGFGIMARDAVGQDKNPDAFPSNMVLVGGYGGCIQSVFRNNVTDGTGAGATMEDVTKFADRPSNDGTVTYKLTMKKTNTGYQVNVNNGTEKIYYRPKQLEVRDKDHIYVGFFVARVSSITVSNIDFTTSNVSTDPPAKPEPTKPIPPVTPSINMTSSSNTGDSNYNLNLSANVKGNVDIKQNGEEIFNGALDNNNSLFKNTTLTSGDNTFDVLYTPDKTQNITSSNPIENKYTVTLKKYGTQNSEVYVSPDATASGDGTLASPIDIFSAIKYLSCGQKIVLRGGTYNLKAPITIDKNNSGTYNNPKFMSAYAGEMPVLNFNNYSGFNLNGNYWNISGVDVTNAVSTGFRISGNHNVVYKVNTYKNGDTGLQISGNSSDKIDKWPSYNLVLDCTSHDNLDPSQNNADGFAAKLTCGVGNVFRGCISHNNCDDGYDLFSKLETGAIGAVTVENSIAYNNGVLSNGTKTLGDGNGFKMGGEGLPVKHVLRNCLSFNNLSDGITSNFDPANTFENCTSFNNGKLNFNFLHFNSAAPQYSAKNNLSFRTSKADSDSVPDINLSDDNYFYNGITSKNKSGEELLASNFKSITVPKSFDRNADGSIIQGDFMRALDTLKSNEGCNLSDFSNVTDVTGTPNIPDKQAAINNNGSYTSVNGNCSIPVDAAKTYTSEVNFDNGSFKATLPSSIFKDSKNSIQIAKTSPSISDTVLRAATGNTLKMIGNPFDIKLYIDGNETHVLNSPITFKIKLNSEDLNGVNTKNLGLYYFNTLTNSWEFVSDALYDSSSSCVTVTTPHLSTFAIMEKINQPGTAIGNVTNASTGTNNNSKMTANTIGKLPKTGSMMDTTTLATLGLILITLGGIVLVFEKRRKA